MGQGWTMRYHEWIKESLLVERLKDEVKVWNELLNKLIWIDGNRGTHSDTGVVYDIRLIDQKISLAELKIKEKEGEL